MDKKHYYIYKGYYWFYPATEHKVFHRANGLIVKSYTDKEFKELHQDTNYVWEEVTEQGE